MDCNKAETHVCRRPDRNADWDAQNDVGKSDAVALKLFGKMPLTSVAFCVSFGKHIRDYHRSVCTPNNKILPTHDWFSEHTERSSPGIRMCSGNLDLVVLGDFPVHKNQG